MKSQARFIFLDPGMVRGETLDTAGQLTLMELANRKAPDGTMARIAEILTKNNAAMMDIPWIEANNTTHHQITREYKRPQGTWRQINGGVQPEAGRTIVVNEPLGMLESYSEPDKKLVDMAPNPESFRMKEAGMFLRGMGDEFLETLFYGNNNTDPEEFDGLQVRLNTVDTAGLVLSQGGSSASANTSIYIVQWSEDSVYMAFPKGNPATEIIKHRDLGEHTKTLSGGAQYQIYRDHFEWNGGLCVEDPRAIARLGNISTTIGAKSFDDDNLIFLLNRMRSYGRGAVMYVHPEIKSQMEIRAKDKSNVLYSTANVFGEELQTFRGVPIRPMETILTTEAVIS